MTPGIWVCDPSGSCRFSRDLSQAQRTDLRCDSRARAQILAKLSDSSSWPRRAQLLVLQVGGCLFSPAGFDG